MVQLIFRHITGSRATEIDVIPLGAHRELILGRAPSAAVRFDPRSDSAVGRHHARIEPGREPGHFQLVDLGSRNGTYLNGRRVTEPVILRAGDILQLGADGPRLEVLVEVTSVPAFDREEAPERQPPDGATSALFGPDEL